MAKTLIIPFSGDPTALLKRAQEAAVQHGAHLSGNTTSGSFSGKGVEGQYMVKANTVEVIITKKPVFVPDSVIESLLRDFFR